MADGPRVGRASAPSPARKPGAFEVLAQALADHGRRDLVIAPRPLDPRLTQLGVEPDRFDARRGRTIGRRPPRRRSISSTSYIRRGGAGMMAANRAVLAVSASVRARAVVYELQEEAGLSVRNESSDTAPQPLAVC